MTCDVRTILFYLFVFVAICGAQRRPQKYQVPTPKVEALYPRGFRVTLEDDGYSFFGFRGNINKEFNGLNEGDIKQDIAGSPNNGKWIYKNRYEELEIGDTIFYWIHVIRNGEGYMNTGLEYTVNEFVNEDGTPVTIKNQASPGPASPDPPSPSWPEEPDEDLGTRFNTPDGNCVISKTVVQGQTSICKDTLIFNEEFDKTSIRELKNWDAETKFLGEPDYPFNMYIPDDTVSFEAGSLVITPVLTESRYYDGFVHEALDLNGRCTGKINTEECKKEASGPLILPPVITAKITTRRSFNFKFGRVEVRAKLPSGSWVMPEINLEPSEHKYGQGYYESGLMRVAFTRGNPSLAKRLYGGPVLSDTEPFRSILLKEKIGIENWYKDFHNYTMVWRPDGIELLVDGQQYGTINPGEGFSATAISNGVDHATSWQTGSIMAPLDQTFHLTLGIRVGGINDFDDKLDNKPWRNSASRATLDFWNNKNSWHPSWYNGAMKVDFVRVYAL